MHEMAHLIAPSHDERFVELLDAHVPMWREPRAELNALPLAVGHAETCEMSGLGCFDAQIEPGKIC